MQLAKRQVRRIAAKCSGTFDRNDYRLRSRKNGKSHEGAAPNED